ncbi:hypothetical protein RhiirA4_418870 [Rhizophagus irregularis]|uniref:DNA endonuclease I-HmuI-like NUMOD-like domain-containing protein n=1 Tax=Rhizophagus irregularis TaxID=588596 RepID=A0A2I1GC80_9GLOM|nr:hypothetical protein RhiirA4_418870 [Rhizophagus irregularis]
MVITDKIMEVWLPITGSNLLVSNLGCIKDKKVVQTFIPNPENKPYVNHINGIRHDNRAINLEWENTQHAIRLGLRSNSSTQRALKVFDDGSIREFPSLAEAQRIPGINRSNICEVCRGIRNHAGGHRWEYINTIKYWLHTKF